MSFGKAPSPKEVPAISSNSNTFVPARTKMNPHMVRLLFWEDFNEEFNKRKNNLGVVATQELAKSVIFRSLSRKSKSRVDMFSKF